MLLDVQRGQVAAVQVVKVTDGQFGFLQLDFNQVALIAAQPQEESSTRTMQLFGGSCIVW